MSSTFLTTSFAPVIDLHLLRRDSFDGFSLLLQDEDGNPLNLTNSTVCASIWKGEGQGTLQKVVEMNVDRDEPFSSGRISIWLSGPQTAAVWDAAQFAPADNLFYPSAHASQARPFLTWDVRIESQSSATDLVSVSAGTFITQQNHGVASLDRVIFKDTSQSSLNYDGTSSTVYTTISDISYHPPYSFRINALSGTTDPAIGGSVYRLKQDTVATGAVIAATTLSNCFV
jgi:hypothetical protein